MLVYGFQGKMTNETPDSLVNWLSKNLGSSFLLAGDNLTKDQVDFLTENGARIGMNITTPNKMLKAENNPHHLSLCAYERGIAKQIALVPHSSVDENLWHTVPCRTVFFIKQLDRTMYVRVLPMDWNKCDILKVEPEAWIF